MLTMISSLCVNLHDELDAKKLNPDKKGDQEKVLKQFFKKIGGGV